ncbi:MAG: sortase-associated OmpA-like protein PdsO [Proteobacteria bacterium]|nr:sortase-associated OmpA-like protein PdsO [Pseudomonadota bacterium]
MLKQTLLTVITATLASTAQADTQTANYGDQTSRQENAGFFTGAVLGAATGGPPGAIIGAAMGALIGNGWNAKEQVAGLQVDLYASQLELAALQEQSLTMQREYQLATRELERLKTTAPKVLPAFLTTQGSDACCDNTVLSVHFRTGSSAIEPHYEEELASLVNLARQMPSVSVEITGYADRNGDAEKNLQLSRQRSDSVKKFFSSKGIETSTISTVAYGETRPLQSAQSFETDFFDRRVMVKLRDPSKQMLTRTPEGE